MVENLQVILIVKRDTWVFTVNRKYVNAQDRFQYYTKFARVYTIMSQQDEDTHFQKILRSYKRNRFFERSIGWILRSKFNTWHVTHTVTPLAKGYEAWLKPVVEITKAAVLKKFWKFAQKLVWTPCGSGVQCSTNCRCILMLPYPFIVFAEWAVCAFCIRNAKHEVARARHILKKV
jgi:hypothetical protein